MAKKIFGPERTDAVQIYVKRVFDEFDDDQSGELSYEGQSICKTKIYYIIFICLKPKDSFSGVFLQGFWDKKFQLYCLELTSPLRRLFLFYRKI